MRIDARDPLTGRILEAAIRVHRVLGPGLLESVYDACLRHELRKAGLRYTAGLRVPLEYDGVRLPQHFRLDFVVEGEVVVELKAVDLLHPVHTAQLITYLRLSGIRRGLLINFNCHRLMDGVRQIVV